MEKSLLLPDLCGNFHRTFHVIHKGYGTLWERREKFWVKTYFQISWGWWHILHGMFSLYVSIYLFTLNIDIQGFLQVTMFNNGWKIWKSYPSEYWEFDPFPVLLEVGLAKDSGKGGRQVGHCVLALHILQASWKLTTRTNNNWMVSKISSSEMIIVNELMMKTEQ